MRQGKDHRDMAALAPGAFEQGVEAAVFRYDDVASETIRGQVLAMHRPKAERDVEIQRVLAGLRALSKPQVLAERLPYLDHVGIELAPRAEHGSGTPLFRIGLEHIAIASEKIHELRMYEKLFLAERLFGQQRMSPAATRQRNVSPKRHFRNMLCQSELAGTRVSSDDSPPPCMAGKSSDLT
jgi:hypothetical protein